MPPAKAKSAGATGAFDGTFNVADPYAALPPLSKRGWGQSPGWSTASATAFQILWPSRSPSSWSMLAFFRANLLAAAPWRAFRKWAYIRTASSCVGTHISLFPVLDVSNSCVTVVWLCDARLQSHFGTTQRWGRWDGHSESFRSGMKQKPFRLGLRVPLHCKGANQNNAV